VYDIVTAPWDNAGEATETGLTEGTSGHPREDDADPIALFATSPLGYDADGTDRAGARHNTGSEPAGARERTGDEEISLRAGGDATADDPGASGEPRSGNGHLFTQSEWEDESRRIERAIREDERSRIAARFNTRRVEAIEEARRAWTALARREEVLRSLVGTHYRILGRTDILYDQWRQGRESTPPLSQRELQDIRQNIEETIFRQVGECDVLMSWERFNEVIQTYDYVITQED
jgi:hypothetical protein